MWPNSHQISSNWKMLSWKFKKFDQIFVEFFSKLTGCLGKIPNVTKLSSNFVKLDSNFIKFNKFFIKPFKNHTLPNFCEILEDVYLSNQWRSQGWEILEVWKPPLWPKNLPTKGSFFVICRNICSLNTLCLTRNFFTKESPPHEKFLAMALVKPNQNFT